MRVETLKIEDIDLNLITNCRNHVDAGDLVESIAETGLQIPVGVVETDDGYGLVYGFRRMTAIKQLGHTEVPARIFDKGVDASDLYIMNLQENSSRQSLNPMEEAKAIQRIMDLGKTVDECRAALGWSKTLVTQRIALLEMDPKIQLALQENKVSVQQARVLNNAEDAHLNTLLTLAEQGATIKELKEEAEILTSITSAPDDTVAPVEDDALSFNDTEELVDTIDTEDHKALAEANSNLIKANLLDCGAKVLRDEHSWFAFQIAVNCVEFDRLPNAQIVALMNAISALSGERGLDAWGEAHHR